MRIRTVKPELFTHEDLYSVEELTRMPARVAFMGLLCAADREGRFKWEPRRLKLHILPYDECDFGALMNALASAGFIVQYGGRYGYIPTFKKHQCVNSREAQSTLPDPSNELHVHAPEFHMPSIPHKPLPEVRDAVMARDKHKCVRCGAREDLTIDHIFPRCVGGTHAETNLRVLCQRCNSARPVAGDELLKDLARDGLTMADMERTCMHVHACESHMQEEGERKGKEGNMEGKGKERNIAPEALAVLAHLSSVTGKQYRAISEYAKDIMSKLKKVDGDVDGVKAMITRQGKLWMGDAKTEQWVRVSTLFGNKFHEYYDARNAPIPTNNGHSSGGGFNRNQRHPNEWIGTAADNEPDGGWIPPGYVPPVPNANGKLGLAPESGGAR